MYVRARMCAHISMGTAGLLGPLIREWPVCMNACIVGSCVFRAMACVILCVCLCVCKLVCVCVEGSTGVSVITTLLCETARHRVAGSTAPNQALRFLSGSYDFCLILSVRKKERYVQIGVGNEC